ncbi:hypothetical protein KAS50_10235 [bacterium]|nr:hypothetical protein [bacterium]
MKRYLLFTLIIVIAAFSLQCGGTTSVLTGRQGDGILVTGGILVENLTLTSFGRYETIEVGVEIVIVGKSEADGKVTGYEVVSDANGYFFLENVPRGSYVIKGIRVFLEDQSTVRFMSNWDSALSPTYYQLIRPEDTINFIVEKFPKKMKMISNILNMNITYFGLEPGSVAYNVLPKLDNRKLHTEKVHNRVNPFDYYKSKFPDVDWF